MQNVDYVTAYTNKNVYDTGTVISNWLLRGIN